MVAAAAIAGPVARRVGERPAALWLLLASLGVIAGVTLTPSPHLDMAGCDLQFAGPTLAELLALNDRSLNVALFIPLGIAVVAIRAGHRLAWLLLAASIAPLIELIQLIVTPLQRNCQAIDVFDNELGLLIGVLVAVIAGWGWRRLRRIGGRTALDPP